MNKLFAQLGVLVKFLKSVHLKPRIEEKQPRKVAWIEKPGFIREVAHSQSLPLRVN